MSLRLLLAALLLPVAACDAATGPSHRVTDAVAGRIWMHLDGAWIGAPSDPDVPASAQVRSANATLFRVDRSGEMTLLHCVVVAHGNALSISAGDGQRLFAGDWSESGDAIDARLHLVYQSIAPVGGNRAEERRAELTLSGKVPRLDGIPYAEARGLDPAEYQELIAAARSAPSARGAT